MDYFDVTFRFNNEDNTLNRFNGLSIDVLAEFLKSLNAVTKGTSEGGLVLSEVKSNCYAIVCSTPNITTVDYIRSLHTQIASGNYSALKAKEREYSNKIMEILSNNLVLNVYNDDKSFYKTIRKMDLPTAFPYFYETDSVIGILTRIGGRNIDTKNSIMVSNYSGEIEITNIQDKRLKDYYKNGIIEFYITKKINKESNKIEKTILDDFTIVSQSNMSFINIIESVREKYGDYFAQIDIEDE